MKSKRLLSTSTKIYFITCTKLVAMMRLWGRIPEHCRTTQRAVQQLACSSLVLQTALELRQREINLVSFCDRVSINLK